ncbi:MAG: hypothetical protein JWR04_1666 [Rhodoglobus sp.]|nr:hypothetical protein [Rhodoglobus sp.]
MDPIHVAVLWFVAEDGSLLIAQRAFDKKQDPGVWGPSVTGKREPGETINETLAREVSEELGITADAYSPAHLFDLSFDHPDGRGRLFSIYAASFAKSQSGLVRLADGEVESFGWSSLETLERWVAAQPETLVPSAAKIWPATFQSLRTGAWRAI